MYRLWIWRENSSRLANCTDCRKDIDIHDASRKFRAIFWQVLQHVLRHKQIQDTLQLYKTVLGYCQNVVELIGWDGAQCRNSVQGRIQQMFIYGVPIILHSRFWLRGKMHFNACPVSALLTNVFSWFQFNSGVVCLYIPACPIPLSNCESFPPCFS